MILFDKVVIVLLILTSCVHISGRHIQLCCFWWWWLCVKYLVWFRCLV